MKVGRTITMASLLIAAGIVLRPLVATEIPSAERRSGYTFMGPETRAMQDDDTANPGMLGVLDGEALWNRKAGSTEKSCANCHDDARVSMKGVAARYPAYDKTLGRPVNLEQRINLCRARHQDATPLPYEKHDLLALTAFVAEQSRRMAIAPDTSREIEPFLA
jgi:sulfur-oxidizing protein SoxA